MYKHNCISGKKIKDKKKDEIITDILNIQIKKGNITEKRVKKDHKHRIKQEKKEKEE